MNTETRFAPHPLMTIKEVSDFLRMPLPTVYYHVQRGIIPGILIGGRWRVHRSAIEGLLRSKSQTAPALAALVATPDADSALCLSSALHDAGWHAVACHPHAASDVLGITGSHPYELVVIDYDSADAHLSSALALAGTARVALLVRQFDPVRLLGLLALRPLTLLSKPLVVEHLVAVIGLSPKAPVALAS